MRSTQMRYRWMGISILLGCLMWTNAQNEARSVQQPAFTSQALRFAQQVDELNPNEVHDLYKVFLVLRCKDVPVEQRKALAKRILTGDYPNKPNFRWYSDTQGGLWVAALVTLSHLHMEDVSLIPFLEEYLPKWERVVAVSEEPLPADLQQLKQRAAPDVRLARALLIRLKAVQAVPEVKSAADLERRLEVMLKEAGLTLEELKQLQKEFADRLRYDRGMGISRRAALAHFLIEEYGRMLFYYARRGMDVHDAYRKLDVVRGWAELGEEARDLSRLIDRLLQERGDDRTRGQLLVDEGVAVVPLIIQKLVWAKEHPNEIADTRMGVAVLLEVLATLIGKEALPYVEPFATGEGGWVCSYANLTKEWIEQGHVFGFNNAF